MDQSYENRKIQRVLAQKKKQLILDKPICIFCLHLVTPRQIKEREVDLCHKIRRSEKSCIHDTFTLQTMDLNIGLGHNECHKTFDNDPENAVHLPGFEQVLVDIYNVDKNIFKKMISNVYFRYLASDSFLWNHYRLESHTCGDLHGPTKSV